MPNAASQAPPNGQPQNFAHGQGRYFVSREWNLSDKKVSKALTLFDGHAQFSEIGLRGSRTIAKKSISDTLKFSNCLRTVRPGYSIVIWEWELSEMDLLLIICGYLNTCGSYL